MRCALLSSNKEGTGNKETATRLASLVSRCGYASSVFDVDILESFDCTPHKLVIGLHGYRSGRFLPESFPRGCTVIVCLGGTDVNLDLSDSKKGEVILRCLMSAHGIVVFSRSMLTELPRFLAAHGTQGVEIERFLSRVALIPQATSLPAGLGRLEDATPLRDLLGLPQETPVILLVAGLRAVKDPLYLLPAFISWRAGLLASAHPLLPALVLVGPALEADLAQRVREYAGVGGEGLSPWGGQGGVFYHSEVPRERLLSWLLSANVLLNTSHSEGQCNSILEAMALGVPVVARSCHGNCALIAHGVNGMLFDTRERGVEACASLLHPSPFRENLLRTARGYVRAHHGESCEEVLWRSFIEKCKKTDVKGGASLKDGTEVASSRTSDTTSTISSYVGHSLSSFTDDQMNVSSILTKALCWLATYSRDSLGPVLLVPYPLSVGVVALKRSWGREGDKDDSFWPSQPKVYDFSLEGMRQDAERCGGEGVDDNRGGGGALLTPSSPSSSHAAGRKALLAQPNIRDEHGNVVRLGWGQFWEDRCIYNSPHFQSSSSAPTQTDGGAPPAAPPGGSRSLHLGVDLEAPEGTPVYCPLSGEVHSVGLDASELGYGPTVIIKHVLRATRVEGGGGSAFFFTLWSPL